MNPLEKILAFHSRLARACTYHRVPYPIALLRALYLYSVHAFSRKEILAYGLYVPSITANIPVLISKQRSLAKLNALNPPDLQYLTKNKDEFYRACRQHDMPIPETYGWTRDGKRFDSDGLCIDGDKAWAKYLSARLPENFIIKDRAGVYGSGFRVFRRVGDTYHSVDSGERHDIGDLFRALSAGGDASDIIIQERLYDAAELFALCGRRVLQTMRVNTLLHDDGRVSILFYMVKIVGGSRLSDNFAMGATGNLIAYGSRDDGILSAAVTVHECGSGMQRIERHPVTGTPFHGFRLPWWSEAIDLAKTGQRCFAGLPTLGWDIALTEDGPRIIEANATWDPPNYAPHLMSQSNWKRIFGGAKREPS
jgi:hypothetical protein